MSDCSAEETVRFLLVLNDEAVGAAVRERLLEHGHHVDCFVGLLDITLPAGERYDALLVDERLPGGSGAQWLRSLRQQGLHAPALLRTDADVDVAPAAELAADIERVAQTLEPDALAARLQALAPQPWLGGEVEIHLARRSVLRKRVRVELTPFEWQLIELLARQRGRAVSRADLARALGGAAGEVSDNAIGVHLYNIRRKLGRHAIETIRGRGFRLRA